MKIKFLQDFSLQIQTNMGVMGSRYFTKGKEYKVDCQDGYLIYINDDVGKAWEIDLNNDRASFQFEIVEEE